MLHYLHQTIPKQATNTGHLMMWSLTILKSWFIALFCWIVGTRNVKIILTLCKEKISNSFYKKGSETLSIRKDLGQPLSERVWVVSITKDLGQNLWWLLLKYCQYSKYCVRPAEWGLQPIMGTPHPEKAQYWHTEKIKGTVSVLVEIRRGIKILWALQFTAENMGRHNTPGEQFELIFFWVYIVHCLSIYALLCVQLQTRMQSVYTALIPCNKWY